jgi:pimeloyl-ACP methyl ester carboxylesterase
LNKGFLWRRLRGFAMAALLLSFTIPPAAVLAQAIRAEARSPQQIQVQGNCQEGFQPGGARYRACLPDGAWNGDLVLYAHGYTPTEAPLGLPGEAERFGAPLRALGYAFATTSYRVNGLAVLPAQEDLLDLVRIFTSNYGTPRQVFLVGASEGGLITALSVERHPDVYDGGLAICGPIGSFRDQVRTFGDFRVVFDAFFPGLIPGPPLQVPEDVRARWPSIYQSRIVPLLHDPASRAKLLEIFAVTGAPFDPARPETIETTLRGVLGYAVAASGDAAAWMDGLPFDNTGRTYRGAQDDAWLNETVQRFAPNPTAEAALQAYETSGRLEVPLVALHTTGDEIVPFFQMEQYAEKADRSSPGQFHSIPIERYGHCNLTQEEILKAFAEMVGAADQQLAALDAKPTPTAIALSPTLTPAPTVGAPTPTGASSRPAGLWQRFVRFLRGLVQL